MQINNTDSRDNRNKKNNNTPIDDQDNMLATSENTESNALMNVFKEIIKHPQLIKESIISIKNEFKQHANKA